MLSRAVALLAALLAVAVGVLNRDHETRVRPGLEGWVNQAGGVRARPGKVLLPSTEEEIAAAVLEAAAEGRVLKVVGAGHSFTPLASPGDGETLVSLDRYGAMLWHDRERGLAEFQAGARIADANRALAAVGLALPTSASLVSQSLAGAVATDTHGSSWRHSGMGALVERARVVDGRGQVLEASAEGDRDLLDAVRCHLGVVGVVSTLTLRVEPAFTLRKVHTAPEPVEGLLRDWDAERRSRRTESLSVYWVGGTRHGRRVELTRAGAEPPTPGLAGAARRLVDRGLPQLMTVLTAAAGAAGPSAGGVIMRAVPLVAGREEIVDDSHEMFYMRPPHGYSHETEYFVPAAACVEGFSAARRRLEAAEAEGRLAFNGILSMRATGATDSMLSPSHGRDSCSIDAFLVQQYGNDAAGREVEAALDAALRPLGGRPHWGKLHSVDHASGLRDMYPRFDDFLRVRERVDPNGVFLGAYARRLLGLGPDALRSYRFEVRGVVQGVFFRATTAERAREVGATGVVRNTARGTVIGLAEGTRAQLQRLRNFLCHEGSPESVIEQCDFFDVGPAPGGRRAHASFEVDYEDAD